ncbi:putative ribosome-binding factor A, mitochondrial [Anthonomus grandis grandis]|uniref:putative ribosome-binding factor A, mitochondrial n=1 Tax=Anthonomus grandis grandis TaxID=2921223 RepID=UPI0021656659|nr:putative ribosome-binding factor A, mitochondrial [Anthonomus grandis grandis]
MLINNRLFCKNFVKIFHKKFHTSPESNSKPGKVLRKIMGVDHKKRKYYGANDTPQLPSAEPFGKTALGAKITGNSRRGNILNKVFMRHITDLMATGENSNELLGYGIEINKIMMSPDNEHIRIFWIANESADSTEVENILNRNAGRLRHELSTLRVMGQIPNIVFVKDRNYYKIMEVQERLLKADFGEEENYEDKLKTDFEILTTLEFTGNQGKEETNLEDIQDMPPMPQNVLGLEHDAILKRVRKGMTASKAPQRSSETSGWAKWSEFKQDQPINMDPVTFANQQEQRKAFKAFLQKRQLLRSKQNKKDKRFNLEKELIEDEMQEKYLQNVGEEIQIEEEDFISEELDEYR